MVRRSLLIPHDLRILIEMYAWQMGATKAEKPEAYIPLVIIDIRGIDKIVLDCILELVRCVDIYFVGIQVV